jgi:hypothetical protein
MEVPEIARAREWWQSARAAKKLLSLSRGSPQSQADNTIRFTDELL